MKKYIALFLAAVLLLGTLAACGSGGANETAGTPSGTQPAETQTNTPEAKPSAEPEQVERVSLNIAYMPNYAALWAITTAIDQGFLDEEGIDVTLYEFADGPTEIAAMESGSIDLAYIGNGAHKLCVKETAYIFLPQQINTTDSVVVNQNSGISSLKDLAGKKIAYASGTSSEASLKNALTEAGLTWDDIDAYEMEASNMVTAMASGTVDACATWSPYTLQIINNVEGTAKLEFENGSLSLASWVALPKYAEENYDIIVRFTRALLKAMDYGSQEANYPYVAQLVADQTATDYDINFYQTEDANWFDSAELTAALADGSLAGYYETQQQNFIDSEVLTADDRNDVNNYVLFDLLDEALNG